MPRYRDDYHERLRKVLPKEESDDDSGGIELPEDYDPKEAAKAKSIVLGGVKSRDVYAERLWQDGGTLN